MISAATRAEWRQHEGEGMSSALGEYTPSEFWQLLDEYECLLALAFDAREIGELNYAVRTMIAKTEQNRTRLLAKYGPEADTSTKDGRIERLRAVQTKLRKAAKSA